MTKKKWMSFAEYDKENGNICPNSNCVGAFNPQLENQDYSTGAFFAYWSCRNCNAHWREDYQLVDYQPGDEDLYEEV